MILIALAAIVVGILISKYYFPSTITKKALFSIFVPLVGGIIINMIIAGCMDSRYGFAFNMGRTMIFVLIPMVAMIITLFITLKVGIKEIQDTSLVKLHTGSGDNRVEFEVSLTQEQLLQMAKTRQQNPEKWKDNEYELVKTIKPDFCLDSIENKNGKNDSEPETQTISLQHINDDKNPSNTESRILENADTHINSIFNNKLESEFRREHKAQPHWIRQNGTEICVNIEEPVYRKMVELQSGDPKRWVDRELDLFYKAQKLIYDIKEDKHLLKTQCSNRFWCRYKKILISAGVICIIISYCVFANYYDRYYSNCNEERMIALHGYCLKHKYIKCDESDFRIRMISSKSYQKKIFNKLPKEIRSKFDDFNDFNRYFEISNSMWIPFVWLL